MEYFFVVLFPHWNVFISLILLLIILSRVEGFANNVHDTWIYIWRVYMWQKGPVILENKDKKVEYISDINLGKCVVVQGR